MKKDDEKRFLTTKNLMLIGLLDETYDLYLGCCNSASTTYTRDATEGFAQRLPSKYTPLCKKLIGKYVDEHIQLFSIRHRRMYVNDQAMGALNMWSVKKTGALHLQVRTISFDAFLQNLEQVIILACLGKERRDRPCTPVEKVEREIRNHVFYQVRQIEEHAQLTTREEHNNSSVQEIWIYSSTRTMKCLVEEHPIQYLPARIMALNAPDCVEIIIRHCDKCNKYFISEQTLAAFEQMYGIMLVRKRHCNVAEENDEGGFFDFCNESELHSRGYNVRADGPSEEERRKLLCLLIDKKIMSAEAVIRDIEWAIKLFESRSHFYPAVRKWKSDLIFVNEHCKQGDPINGALRHRTKRN